MLSADKYNAWTRQKTTLFSGHYLRNRSTLDQVFWVISVQFNTRNTLPKSGTFLLGHPVYTNTPGLAQYLRSRNSGAKSNFAHVVIQHKCGRLRQYILVQRSVVEIQTATHWKSAAARPPGHLLSPSSIIPPLSSHCDFIQASKKFGTRFKNVVISSFFSFLFQSCVSLKMPKPKTT